MSTLELLQPKKTQIKALIMTKKNGFLLVFQSTAFFWLMALTVIIFASANELFFQRYNFAFTGDYWEHTGVFSEWLKNLWQPGMPHVSGYEDGASARYMPYYLMLTAIGQVFSLTPVQIMSMAGITNVILLCFGIQYFFKHYFQKPLAPLFGLIVFFCFWGTAWYWSNVYQLRNLVYTAGYPSTFTFALCLFSLGYITNMLRKQSVSIVQWLSVAVLSFLMFVCHPLTGAFGIGAAGLLVLTHSDTTLKQRIKLIVALLVGFIATELWPYYSAIDIALGQTAKESHDWVGGALSKAASTEFSPLARAYYLYYSHPFYSPIDFVMSLGPALLGIPALCWLAYKRQQLFLTSGFILMMLPFCINLFIAIPLGHRFLLFAIIFLHIAIVWAFLNIYDYGSQYKKKIATAILLILALSNIYWAGAELNGISYSPNLTKKQVKKDATTVSEKFEELKAIIPENAVVMAPLKTSWPLPTFLPAKTVGLFHGNPYVQNIGQRESDVKTFFAYNTSQHTSREIIERYKVTHIIVPRTAENAANTIAKISTGAVTELKHWFVITL
jgi:hypothetical protein